MIHSSNLCYKMISDRKDCIDEFNKWKTEIEEETQRLIRIITVKQNINAYGVYSLGVFYQLEAETK